jgi:SAM-dependent methyltransferase
VPHLEIDGFCPICQCNVQFRAHNAWLRDSLLCSGCGSIPRERAIFAVIEMLYPQWRDLQIHETSPTIRGASLKLKTECPGYTYSYYNEQLALGSFHPQEGYRCENIDRMTFGDETFDLFISQDVFEHIFNPEAAIKEIVRILRLGGSTIMTVPLVRKSLPSERRAVLRSDGSIVNLKPPEYHGNPINDKGALVTIDWGYDIAAYLSDHSRHPSWIVYLDDLSRGIRAEYIEVVIVRKGAPPSI